MSKSKGNIIEPWEVINQSGADAMRWYMLTSSPPAQERRFSTELVNEVVRNFTLTLWNTYSFFVTYANLDRWTPDPEAALEYSELDRWLRSTMHSLIRDVTQAMETYDVLGATRPIETFVDQLSNWYLRRSRRRFWKSESDADKQAAYATLHEALVTVSKLLAPSMPFIAEELFQNLVREFDRGAPESVHMTEWPAHDEALIDEKLNREMSLVMKLASVGHAARNKANRKVRQPLSEAAFSVGNLEEVRVIETFADILQDELNVKQVRSLDTASEVVAYTLNPLPKQLGQKYGSRYPAIRQVLLELDAEQAAHALLDGKAVDVAVGSESVSVLPEEVEVRAQAREGYAVASEGAYLAALVTELTPELINEGLAREFVRRVQDLRKQADLDISDRIRLYFHASPGLARAIQDFSSYIMGETLTVDLVADNIPENLARNNASFDGEEVIYSLEKVG